MKRNSDFSFERFFSRLTKDEDPALAGAVDGRSDYPAPASSEPSAFQMTLQARARDEAHKVASHVQKEVQHFVDDCEGNPFALPGRDPIERCRTIRQAAVEAVEGVVGEHRQELFASRELALDRRRQRDLDFQRAGGEPPPGPLPSLARTLLTTTALCGLEGAGAYFLLAGAVEPVTAFVSGIAIPAFMTLLGGTAAFLALNPANRKERRSAKQAWKRAGAISLGLIAAVVTICCAAWRSALINGRDGTSSDIWAAFGDPLQLLASSEAWALAGISAVAFIVAYYEVNRYFGGFVRALRASEEACREAEEERLGNRDNAVGQVAGHATAGRDEIANIVQFAGEWARTTRIEAQRARGAILEGNRYLENLENAVQAVDALYRSGNERIRSQAPPVWQPILAFSDYFAVPPVIDEAPRLAASNSVLWAEVAREEAAAIGDAELKAVAFIDSLVEIDAPDAARPALPTPALPWRALPV